MSQPARRTADDLKRDIDLVQFIAAHGVELKQDGPEYRGLCPFHKESTPSFTVTPAKRTFYCFGCAAGGSVVDFAQRLRGGDLADAFRYLDDWSGGAAAAALPAPAPANDNRKRTDWTPADTAPTREAGQRDLRHHRYGEPAKVWTYRGADGGVLGYVARFQFDKVNKDTGEVSTGKDVLPLTWCKSEDGRTAWRWQAFGKPRPLYGLDRLAQRPQAQVLVVEGEKAADAAQSLLPAVVVVTWPGGGKAVRFADWSPLQGRKVVLWPDRDAPGTAAMEGWLDDSHALREGVAQLAMAAGAAGVRVVDVPPGEPDGWDLADAQAEGWDGAKVLAWIRANNRDVRQPVAAPAPQQQEPPAAPPADDGHPEMPPDAPMEYDHSDGVHTPPVLEDDEPFRMLGFGPGPTYFYQPSGTNLVTELSPGAHTPAHLLTLAPKRYWERTYGDGGTIKREGWHMVINALLQRQHAVGMFDPDMVRGRGAWFDDGHAAVHIGDAVVLNGRRYALGEVPSRYVYQRGKPLHVHMDDPLTNNDASQLVRICELLSWEKPINAKLLAGWCMLAPICGALAWRPHIWVTGGAGSGKSTVMSLIVHRTLGGVSLFVQSATTEAGLRQALQSDALPVVFDEAESEDDKAEARINNIMGLVTQASSETGARIVKGSAGGQAMMYSIRSMFAFSSIGINLRQYAARTRVTVLGLVRQPPTPEAQQNYNDLLRKIHDTLTDDYVHRLHARAIHLIPVIRKNAETFRAAATIVLGSQRLGDQVGALLAGAYALHNTAEVSRDFAERWVREQDWEEVAQVSEQADEQACLSYLLQSVVECELQTGRVKRSIAELVAAATYRSDSTVVPPGEAKDTLRRNGLKISDDGKALVVANAHKMLAQLLEGTPWSGAWSRTLLRVQGAEKVDPSWFANGVKQRGVAVPLSAIFG